ncbi:hypothetical protein HYC85_003322 [Camellia sinensis]|uniref:Uncharacterized protein n=1 Tax=Camellia sinensis TaxID=4442 RepID=A0A7J7IAZ0_CAMSI|nr:hypothetical protein HYC85_003322 [Camellia sinensis]
MSFQLFLGRFRGLCSTISTAPLTCYCRSSDRSPLPMGRLSGKGACFFDNEARLEFTSGDRGLGGGVLHLKVRSFYHLFIMLRGYPGFYSYAILEHSEGWPDIKIYQGRIVFKLEESLFQYMAISDERQRIMPTPQDREAGLVLDYPEAVMLTNPSNPELTGEVDDKYQYSCDDKDNRVHGWICSNPAVGFWMITPSDEFRTGGPVKQDLTSHVGPTTLSMFFSTHYAGDNLTIKLRDGETWKKVFGPVLIYLNSVSVEEDALTLWEDAKEQVSAGRIGRPAVFGADRQNDFGRGHDFVAGDHSPWPVEFSLSRTPCLPSAIPERFAGGLTLSKHAIRLTGCGL